MAELAAVEVVGKRRQNWLFVLLDGQKKMHPMNDRSTATCFKFVAAITSHLIVFNEKGKFAKNGNRQKRHFLPFLPVSVLGKKRGFKIANFPFWFKISCFFSSCEPPPREKWEISENGNKKSLM